MSNVTPTSATPLPTPAPQPAPAPAPQPAPQQAPATQAADPKDVPQSGPKTAEPTDAAKTKPEKPAKPVIYKDEFKDLDKSGDKKLAKSELKLDKGEKFKDYDKDGDGSVNVEEYRAESRRKNSFKGLDGDGDGKLSTEEMGKMRRFTSEADNAFDHDGDGSVSKDEFMKARKVEFKANREAVREHEFDHLSAKDKKKFLEDKKYDTDGDGKMSLDEYKTGRHKDWVEGRTKKMDYLFDKAGGKDGSLDVSKAKEYKAYDKDNDGKVSKDEFKDGFMADRKAFWETGWEKGEIPKELKSRLGLSDLGFGLNHIPEEKKAEHAGGAKALGETKQTPDGVMVKRGDEYLSEKIIGQYDKMVAAAKKDGVSIELEDGYRSYDEQVALYNAYLNGTGNLAAKPGTSNHQSGTAMDIRNNPGAWDWMKANSEKFGFKNLPAEAWHYSLDGR